MTGNNTSNGWLRLTPPRGIPYDLKFSENFTSYANISGHEWKFENENDRVEDIIFVQDPKMFYL